MLPLYSKEFEAVWRDCIDNPRPDSPAPGWLDLHENMLKPFAWKMWKIGRELLHADMTCLMLQAERR